jgi:2-(1,2-epoxy-1,2-dihydrophenyl)acetyl-CoA isomerase
MTVSYTTIEFEIAAGVASIALNRPERLNSFNGEMHAELRQVLGRVEQADDVRAVILTGRGRGFCAGQDLSDRAVAPGADRPQLSDSLEQNYNPLVRRLRALPKPVVCAVNGVAAGAGANVALACDIVVAARSARFIQPFCRIGLIPDSGGTWFLPRLVGRARALGLAMLGDTVSAEQAHAWGMIWQVVDDDALETTAHALAAHLATQPTYGLGLMKRAFDASGANSLDAQLDLERELQRRAGASSDYAEGVGAFLAKRAPIFQGK